MNVGSCWAACAGERVEVHAGVSFTLYGWFKPNSGLATACLRAQTNIRSS